MLPYVDNIEIFRNSSWYMQNSLNILLYILREMRKRMLLEMEITY